MRVTLQCLGSFMKGLSMISSDNNFFWSHAAAMVYLAILASGCSQAMMQKMFPPTVPNVKGTWTGRLERVRLYDTKGSSYDAVELHIDSGPEPKGYYPGDLNDFPGA